MRIELLQQENIGTFLQSPSYQELTANPQSRMLAKRVYVATNDQTGEIQYRLTIKEFIDYKTNALQTEIIFDCAHLSNAEAKSKLKPLFEILSKGYYISHPNVYFKQDGGNDKTSIHISPISPLFIDEFLKRLGNPEFGFNESTVDEIEQSLYQKVYTPEELLTYQAIKSNVDDGKYSEAIKVANEASKSLNYLKGDNPDACDYLYFAGILLFNNPQTQQESYEAFELLTENFSHRLIFKAQNIMAIIARNQCSRSDLTPAEKQLWNVRVINNSFNGASQKGTERDALIDAFSSMMSEHPEIGAAVSELRDSRDTDPVTFGFQLMSQILKGTSDAALSHGNEQGFDVQNMAAALKATGEIVAKSSPSMDDLEVTALVKIYETVQQILNDEMSKSGVDIAALNIKREEFEKAYKKVVGDSDDDKGPFYPDNFNINYAQRPLKMGIIELTLLEVVMEALHKLAKEGYDIGPMLRMIDQQQELYQTKVEMKRVLRTNGELVLISMSEVRRQEVQRQEQLRAQEYATRQQQVSYSRPSYA